MFASRLDQLSRSIDGTPPGAVRSIVHENVARTAFERGGAPSSGRDMPATAVTCTPNAAQLCRGRRALRPRAVTTSSRLARERGRATFREPFEAAQTSAVRRESQIMSLLPRTAHAELRAAPTACAHVMFIEAERALSSDEPSPERLSRNGCADALERLGCRNIVTTVRVRDDA